AVGGAPARGRRATGRNRAAAYPARPRPLRLAHPWTRQRRRAAWSAPQHAPLTHAKAQHQAAGTPAAAAVSAGENNRPRCKPGWVRWPPLNLALSTMRARQSTLSSFCAWLVKRGLLNSNPVAEMDRLAKLRRISRLSLHPPRGARALCRNARALWFHCYLRTHASHSQLYTLPARSLVISGSTNR